MSVDAKRSYGTTVILIALGLFALYAGAHWLMVLVPAAIACYAVTRSTLRSSRN
jgi:hypothetical protein